MKKTFDVKRLTTLALLTTIALTIFVVESAIPTLVPIPGVKLGLANIITVYAAYRFSAKDVLLIAVTRVFLGSLFGGNFSVIIYSLSGALACLAGMLLLRKIIPLEYVWLCSIIGAILHNTGQMAAAIFITRTPAVLAYYPPLIISGSIAGLFTGLCAMFILKRVKS